MASNPLTLLLELDYKNRETNSITDEATHRHKVDTPPLVLDCNNGENGSTSKPSVYATVFGSITSNFKNGPATKLVSDMNICF